MGFFDTVLEENTKAMTSVATTKKDDQDGAFLIIDDSVSAASIPDTAVQLFDAAPIEDIQDTAPVSEISFFSEPSIQTEVSSVETTETAEVAMETIETPIMENTFFNESEITSEVSSLSTPVESVEITSETIDTPFVLETSVMEVVPEKTTVAVTEEVMEDIKEVTVTNSSIDANDIYAPMKRAIAEYETFLSVLMENAKKEDDKIEISNAQIAEAKEIAKRAIDTAKESAKVALEKRKTLDMEMKRIEEMKNVLSLQIK